MKPEMLDNSLHKKDCSCSQENNSYNWSRLGPMGQLLEPKLYPVDSKLSPRTTNGTANQPYQDANIFLKHIQDKYYERSQTQPVHDALRRINEDRYKTTYQVAYGNDIEYGYLDYDDLDLSDKFKCKDDQVEELRPCKIGLRLPYIGGHDIPGIKYHRTNLLDNDSGNNKKIDKDQDELSVKKSSIKQTRKKLTGSKGAKSSGTGKKKVILKSN
ncbi:hypothetical protein HCN44_007640 [Aphidius gifuensis]|uniref:Uncharacterized protein n=1 Tax=Aphidius gifuensis TaxID=684658 RepID=A0A834XLE3_APHGI|nr:hypothetical protein HCN44_007640 [Aphidius gifuensis]